MNKAEILAELKNDIYCRLQVSENGIGVFAIKDIPSGIDPFRGSMKCCTEFIEFSEEEVGMLDREVARLVIDMCPKQNGMYQLPDCGLSHIDCSYYLNCSPTYANMKEVNEGEIFITKRLIHKGEELLIDYNTYSEDDGEVWYTEGTEKTYLKEIKAGEGYTLHQKGDYGC